jgi:glutathione peroxidase-family protein
VQKSARVEKLEIITNEQLADASSINHGISFLSYKIQVLSQHQEPFFSTLVENSN